MTCFLFLRVHQCTDVNDSVKFFWKRRSGITRESLLEWSSCDRWTVLDASFFDLATGELLDVPPGSPWLRCVESSRFFCS